MTTTNSAPLNLKFASARPNTWQGVSDNKTSPHSFHATHDWQTQHLAAFRAVLQKIDALNRRRLHGRKIIEVIYYRADADVLFVAYRFTSDLAYDRFQDRLVHAGSSLGRGGFEPFGSRSTDLEEYVNRRPTVALAA